MEIPNTALILKSQKAAAFAESQHYIKFYFLFSFIFLNASQTIKKGIRKTDANSKSNG